MLVRRGPYAYRNFVRCLIETHQHVVCHHLEETRSSLHLPPSLPNLMQGENVTFRGDASSEVLPSIQPFINNAEYRLNYSYCNF